MINQKIWTLLILCSIAIGFIVPVAKAEEPFGMEYITETTLLPFEDALELVQNGGMEYTASETSLNSWSISAPSGENFLGSNLVQHNDIRCTDGPKESQIVSDGKRAVRLIHAGGSVETRLTQTLNFQRSEDITSYRCEMGASFYKLSATAPSQLVAKVTLRNDAGATEEKSVVIPFSDITRGQWTRRMVAFTLPAETIGVSLTIRLARDASWKEGETGDLIVDNVFFRQTCEDNAIAAAKPTVKKVPVEGTAANLIGFTDSKYHGNVDFEYAQAGNTPWWFVLDTPVAERFSTAENHTPDGTKSLYLKNITNIRGRAYQNVSGLIPGATYQISWWYKIATAVQATVSTEIKFHAASKPAGDATYMGVELGGGYACFQDDIWQEMVVEFTAPFPPTGGNDLSAEVCIRIGGANTSAYFDDVSMYMVKEPDVADIESDEAIYYTEWNEGIVTAKVNHYYDSIMQNGGKMRCTFLDGTVVLQSPQTVSFTEIDGTLTATWRFPTNLMEANKQGQTYFYKAEILGKDGKVLQETMGKVYRFDRPHYLGVDGIFRKNGKEYNIGVGNSASTKVIAKDPVAGGVQIVLLVGEGDIPLIEKMDQAYAAGCLVMLNMGTSEACAGSPAKIEQTRDTVRKARNHPALFGYKIQDEPTQKGTSEEYLCDGYVAIRELDKNHVVYACDGVVGLFPVLARYTDYMDSDHYPGGKNSASIIYNSSKKAEEASHGRKPFAILQKAYQVLPSDMYMPTIDEYRHYAYQTLFAGAAGWGYHQIGSNTAGDPFMDRPIWQEIVGWKASGEQKMMLDCFVNGKYPMINAYADDEIKWQLYAADGKLYAFILNCVGGVGTTSGNKTVNIPLTDISKGKTLGDFTATCKWGGKGSASGTDTLSVTINSFTAEVWEITLAESVDFSDYKIVKYNDIADVPWAYQAVARLKEEEIINEETTLRFNPFGYVARGDYAMFLVRALGLTATPRDNFADISPEAEYAKDVAIGKALGIFKGTDENLFHPKQPITRLELMTMTTCALRCAGAITSKGTGAGDFTEEPTVPDWAVLDVASCMRLAALRGESGEQETGEYATRAVAAVVIDRVRQWKKAADAPWTGDFITGYANWLDAAEARMLWEALLNEEEGDFLANGLWNRIIDGNGNRYWLIANCDDTEKSTWCSYTENTRTAVLQSKGVTAYAKDGELHVTLPPGTVAVYRMAPETNGRLLKNGVYLSNYEEGATVSLSDGVYGVWYRYNGEKGEMIQFLEEGEEMNGLLPQDKLKFFSWDCPRLHPKDRVVEYGKNAL